MGLDTKMRYVQIKQFRYAADNLGYLVYGTTAALAIDGGAVDAMLSFCRSKHLTLEYIVNTHGHGDHTAGNQALARASDGVVIAMAELLEMGQIALEGRRIEILHTPGHTADSVSFKVANALITGDTLFNGTVGNCFSGDLHAFYRSVKTLMGFDPQTIIYAGHDYVRESMAFAAGLAGADTRRRIATYLADYDPGLVRSTLAQELAVNPYLRFNSNEIRSLLAARGLAVETECQRWCSLMSIG